MSTRRLHPEQPESFAFSPENLEWARGQIAKFPKGRQASAVIPLLFRAQEQEGWLSRPAIEAVATMLEMPSIRALEVATFYFMFRLAPIGRVAHVEVCGTTPCMLCGAEDLVGVCREKIASAPHTLSADHAFSWEEVECLGACANAPMVQIGKDYYEDLNAVTFAQLLDELAAWGRGEGEKPRPGSRKGRFASEPLGGATTLREVPQAHPENMSVALAIGTTDAPRRISGGVSALPKIVGGVAVYEETTRGPRAQLAPGEVMAPETDRPAPVNRPADGGDDLTRIRGVGPQLEALLHELGYFTFQQIASWTEDNVNWVDQNLSGFRGRIRRDDWVAQARAFVAEAEGAE